LHIHSHPPPTFAADLRVAPIHGGLHQSQRGATIKALETGQLDVLVGTDLVARGIDVPSVMTVVCYEPPTGPQVHTHRVGRTGRGVRGCAVKFFFPFFFLFFLFSSIFF
jgi:superfamily II DNA/RNA helicase